MKSHMVSLTCRKLSWPKAEHSNLVFIPYPTLLRLPVGAPENCPASPRRTHPTSCYIAQSLTEQKFVSITQVLFENYLTLLY